MTPRQALKSIVSFVLALTQGVCAHALPAALTQIGVAGGVRGPVNAYLPPPAEPVGRVLASGEPLYLDEKIVSGPDGSLQVMLLDETVFTIGPNSSMVLDEFVYDPKTSAGKVVARVTKGAFRFVTGQIGHRNPSDMKVRFPAGTLGIRGTIVAGTVGERGTTVVLLGPGAATNAAGERVGAFSMENAGSRVDVVKPGYGTHVDGPDAPPSVPVLLPKAQLDSILRAVGGAAPAPRAAAPSAPADGQASAADDSGQSTAQASGDLSGTEDVAVLTMDSDALSQAAADQVGDLLSSYQSSWDDVRSIPSGTGYYAGTDNFYLLQCNGGACTSPSGSMSLYLDVDFGAKTVGSAASKVTIAANDPTLAAPINATVPFPNQSYAASAGPATLSNAAGGASASVSLLNVGGVAGAAAAAAGYSAGGTAGFGTVVAPLTCTAGTCTPP